MVNPYANITFVDPKGRLYKFTRATTVMPETPKETMPHPYGVDVELLQRLIQITTFTNMSDFKSAFPSSRRNHCPKIPRVRSYSSKQKPKETVP